MGEALAILSAAPEVGSWASADVHSPVLEHGLLALPKEAQPSLSLSSLNNQSLVNVQCVLGPGDKIYKQLVLILKDGH